MRLFYVLFMLPQLAGALAIDFGDSLRPDQPVTLYYEGRAFHYQDEDVARYLLLLFRLTYAARDASFSDAAISNRIGRQVVPGWMVDGARVRDLGRKLLRAKVISAEPPPGVPTKERLIAYFNSEGPALSQRTVSMDVKTLAGVTSVINGRLDDRNAQDPLSALLAAYSWDWPVTRRVRDALTFRHFQ